MEHTLAIFDKLNFAGVQLVAVSQSIDSHNDEADVLLAIHGLMDSRYVKELGKKTHRGLEGCVLRGLSAGGRCFGYDTVPVGDGTSKQFVVNESEAVIVRRIFESYVRGLSLKKIATELNAEGFGRRGHAGASNSRRGVKPEFGKCCVGSYTLGELSGTARDF